MSNPKIIAVDFDGTLCENAFPNIGKPIDEIIKALLYEKEHGAIIILDTMREGKRLEEAVTWCSDHGITFDTVNDNCEQIKKSFGNNPRKIFANEYWDDHNVLVPEIKEKWYWGTYNGINAKEKEQ